MKDLKLNLPFIYEDTGDVIDDAETLVLDFNLEGYTVHEFFTPYEDKYVILYSGKLYGDSLLPIEELSVLHLENYREIEKYIDLPDALPEISFSLVDEDEVWEEEISLRDFLKKYIFHYNILKDAKKAQKKYIAELYDTTDF
ncbi:MAG: hypothetical protein Q4E36_02105 [Bacillota bacterium]|nr:hypothetical protein [Bacillota bacterium]